MANATAISNGSSFSCSKQPLLDLAVGAGNVEVVKYLLGPPYHVDPRTALPFCKEYEHTWPANPMRLEAARLVLRALGGNINLTVQGRTTPLARCHSPQIVQLYLENGAIIDQGERGANALEVAIGDALGWDPAPGPGARMHAMERVRLYVRFGHASIMGRRSEKGFRDRCATARETWVTEHCRELARLIRHTEGTFRTGS